MVRGQPAARRGAGEEAGDQLPGPVLVQAVEVGYAARRGRLPSAVARGVAEGAGGGLGVGVRGDGTVVLVRASQQPDRFNLVHHHRGDRHRQSRGAHLGNQVARRGRGRQREHRVDARVGADDLQAPAEDSGRDFRGGIDRPGHRGTGGEHVPECPPGIPGQAGDLQACVAARVGGEHPAAAGIGHHADPASGRRRLRRQQRHGVEELAEVSGSDDARLLEQGLPGQQRCFRRRGARGG